MIMPVYLQTEIVLRVWAPQGSRKSTVPACLVTGERKFIMNHMSLEVSRKEVGISYDLWDDVARDILSQGLG